MLTLFNAKNRNHDRQLHQLVPRCPERPTGAKTKGRHFHGNSEKDTRRQLVVVAQVAGLQAGEAMCMDNLTAILAAGKSDFF